MSLLIRGMEMPKTCHCCRMCVQVSDGDIDWHWECCLLCEKVARYATDRIPDCPLVPVPPHGDLIDRNKLYEKTAEWEAQALHMVEVTMHDEDTTEWRKWSTVLTERSAFKFDVADAPTIIPAEEGE